MNKYKILLLSDHMLSTSGVGTQTRFLVDALLKTGKYEFVQLAGAVKHESYEVLRPAPGLTLIPVDGFGNRDMLRVILARDRPDALFLFTDPRFFIPYFEISDEIHQICPIVYWHLWDQCEMAPTYNKVLYESTDLINCINRPTYEMAKAMFPDEPDKVNWAPHAIPKGIYKKLPPVERAKFKQMAIPNKPADEFIGLWVNRNAHRKRPGDILMSWKMFLDELQSKHGHRKATLIMHTDPYDMEGPNLIKIVEHLGILNNVSFSVNRVGFDEMNAFYNVADFIVNAASAEGFGLPTLEAAYAGTPVIALKTGGLTRQVVDHRDDSENGIALPVEVQRVCGSQHIPFIKEDHVSHETVAKAFMKMYELGDAGRQALGAKAREYVNTEFVHDDLVKLWDTTMTATIEKFKAGKGYKPWQMRVL